MHFQTFKHLGILIGVALVLTGARRGHAIGWDGDDILMTGYGFTGDTSKSNRVAVYDHDLTFKGLLDPSFNLGTGLDFNAAGNLVAASHGGEVRVYESSGARAGGFTNAALGAAVDLKVAPDSTYVVGFGQLITGTGEHRSAGVSRHNDHPRALCELYGGIQRPDQSVLHYARDSHRAALNEEGFDRLPSGAGWKIGNRQR